MEQPRYYFLCAMSGLFWCGIAFLLLGEWFPALWGGIGVSPFIGLMVGLAHRRTYSLPLILRVFLSLVTLYAAAVLYGIALGVTEAAIESNPNVVKSAVVIGWLLATLWGVTFTGYFLVLWPLAFANHWLLGWSLKK